MKSKGFLIRGEFFPTKKALENRIRAIRDKYKDDNQLTPDNFDFLLDVLEGHPQYDIKRGPGIVSIYVKTNPTYTNNRCFWLIRTDGTETDFSFKECLTPTPHDKKFFRALRAAIEPFTWEFKKNFFDSLTSPAYCPYTRERLEFVGSHVDHKVPLTFERLVDDFVQANGIDIDQISVAGDVEDNTYQNTLVDQELKERWISYHNQRAVLQVVSRRANLSILRTRN